MDNLGNLQMMEGELVISVENVSDSDYSEAFKITFENGWSIIIKSISIQEHNVFNVFWQKSKKDN